MSPRSLALAAYLALGIAGPARGDGFYLAESLGVSAGHGSIADAVGGAFRLRLGLGMRLGNFAIEPWFTSDLQTDRIGGFRGVVGGMPGAGLADLTTQGVDLKYLVPLDRHIDVYLRGGPLIAEGNGALDGYRSLGLGAAVGAQLSGKVRALGFLWAPLFWLERGPLVTGALFLDVGYDATLLRMSGGPPLDAGIAHVSVGFAVGSAF